VVITTELLILSLLLLAIFSHFLSNRESSAAKSIREKYGIPYGRVIYSDLDRPAKALFSRKLGISGKPDYVISHRRYGGLVPVEIKSGRAANPYRNHVLQLAAYCLLVEETYHKSVPYGIIVYSDGKQHKIIFDESLRSELIGVVKEMKRSMRSGCPARGHDQLRKCRSCSYQSSCRYCLADT
jgi:CRISPR-associated exonuclease Cas4